MKKMTDYISTALRFSPKTHCYLKFHWNNILSFYREYFIMPYYRQKKKIIRKYRRFVARKELFKKISEINCSINDLTNENKDSLKKNPSIILVNLTSSPKNISFMQVSHLILGWILRLKGVKVYYLFCNKCMIRCPQGPYRTDPPGSPLCSVCIKERKKIFNQQNILKMSAISSKFYLDQKTDLMKFKYKTIEIGRIVVHTLRHTLRRYTLDFSQNEIELYNSFNYSAVSVAQNFEQVLEKIRPQKVILFNGVFFPEATIFELCKKKSISTITYETGFREKTLFFSHELAPSYSIKNFSKDLSQCEDRQLDKYLQRRFSGNFQMGFTSFWGHQVEFPSKLKEKMKQYDNIVSIFTNTLYDTSVIFSNYLFESLYDWLKQTLAQMKKNPNTLFIVRAHPDEFRGGKDTRKRTQRSLELIEDFLRDNDFFQERNFFFISPLEYISSYELIKISSFSIMYNSTIGLEAAILGCPILLGGHAKFSNISTISKFKTIEEYLGVLNRWLTSPPGRLSAEEIGEARAFFFHLFFKSSFDFSSFLTRKTDGSKTIELLDFPLEQLTEKNPMIKNLLSGILNGDDFKVDSP